MDLHIKGGNKTFNIETSIPGDKSIGHRSFIIGAIPKGEYKIYNFPFSEDCNTTLDTIKKLGVDVKEILEEDKKVLNVFSPGYENFNRNILEINANNSGTTARLILGLLSGTNVSTVITGDDSLSKRPMNRVLNPLISMGAKFECSNGYLPIKINNNNGINGIKYEMPVDSAQVKSAILIAGFFSNDNTIVIEKNKTRNHTEKMFKYLGSNINVNENKITISNSKLISKDIYVPGDPSTAAFLIVATIISKDSSILIKDVLLNKGRLKYVDILKNMGANIEIIEKGFKNEEPIGDIVAFSSNLSGITIEHSEIASIIDEIPILSVAAAFANGETIFENVEELKYKESNRIKAMEINLAKANIKTSLDNDYNFKVIGNNQDIESDVKFDSYNDHRIALASLVLAIKNKGNTLIKNYECTNISFPNSLKYFKPIINIEEM